VPSASILALWQLGVDQGSLTRVPDPLAVAEALLAYSQNGLLPSILASVERVAAGFVLAAVLGIFVGTLMAVSPRCSAITAPLMEMLRPIPPLAWIPLSIAFFGMGDLSAIFIVFLGSFFAVATTTRRGFADVDPLHRDVGRALGLSPLHFVRYVLLPSALPHIFSGLSVGLGFSWMCVVAAEMIAANSGLGYDIQLHRQLLQLDWVLAGMAAIGVLGAASTLVLGAVEQRVLPWKYQTSAHSGKPAAVASAPVPTPRPPKSALAISELSFHYESRRPILHNLELYLRGGEIVSLVGPSGCGKSTLLRLIAGLEKPTSGHISITAAIKPLTVVFQKPSLFPWMTVEQNVTLAHRAHGIAAKEALGKALPYITALGLGDRLPAYPQHLSGGELQRAALARALTFNPYLLLLDEPLSALDEYARESIQEELLALLSSLHSTVMLITHDVEEAAFMSDRIVVLDAQAQITGEVVVHVPRPRGSEHREADQFLSTCAQIRHYQHQTRVLNSGREKKALGNGG
jgi:ABC-type nitrate/sulfonate/bicarbonate transport system ATPase subunit/ABC-type nitrate/sulfonate/bicarbonate transport system permease component